MNIQSESFQIIPSKPVVEQLESGCNSYVRKFRAQDADFVQKTPIYQNKSEWLQGMQDAESISDKLRLKNNPAYFVPKTFVSNNKVYEEFVSGKTLNQDILEKYSEYILPAIAHFINDMSELCPVKKNANPVQLFGIGSFLRFDDFLKSVYGIISLEEKKKLKDIYKYLFFSDLNTESLFSHNDLHGGNILFDKQTKQVSFIDFDLSGFRLKYSLLNVKNLELRRVLPYLQKLSRVTNPCLSWDKLEKKLNLYNAFYTFFYDVLSFVRMSNGVAQHALKQKIRPLLDNLFSLMPFIYDPKPLNKAALVSMRHYQKIK